MLPASALSDSVELVWLAVVRLVLAIVALVRPLIVRVGNLRTVVWLQQGMSVTKGAALRGAP